MGWVLGIQTRSLPTHFLSPSFDLTVRAKGIEGEARPGDGGEPSAAKAVKNRRSSGGINRRGTSTKALDPLGSAPISAGDDRI